MAKLSGKEMIRRGEVLQKKRSEAEKFFPKLALHTGNKDDHSIKQLVKILDISEGTIRGWFRRWRKRSDELIEREENSLLGEDLVEEVFALHTKEWHHLEVEPLTGEELMECLLVIHTNLRLENREQKSLIKLLEKAIEDQQLVIKTLEEKLSKSMSKRIIKALAEPGEE